MYYSIAAAKHSHRTLRRSKFGFTVTLSPSLDVFGAHCCYYLLSVYKINSIYQKKNNVTAMFLAKVYAPNSIIISASKQTNIIILVGFSLRTGTNINVQMVNVKSVRIISCVFIKLLKCFLVTDEWRATFLYRWPTVVVLLFHSSFLCVFFYSSFMYITFVFFFIRCVCLAVCVCVCVIVCADSLQFCFTLQYWVS